MEKENSPNETNNKKIVASAIDQWLAINHRNQVYKIVSCICGGLVVFLIVGLMLVTGRDPLVVVESSDSAEVYVPARKPINIDEPQIKRFVNIFLVNYLRWEKLEPSAIARQFEPLTTPGLQEKLKNQLIDKRERGLKDKAVSQDFAFLKVKVTEKSVVATFDKILHVNGIPLVVPCEISFQITQGPQTNWNTLGLYVNGLIEHEGSNN
jgi:hypothetical protein